MYLDPLDTTRTHSHSFAYDYYWGPIHLHSDTWMACHLITMQNCPDFLGLKTTKKKWCFPWADKSRKTTMSPSTITLSTCAGVTQISWTYYMKSWSQDLLKALQHLIQTPAGRMHWKRKAGLRDIIIIFFFCYWQPVPWAVNPNHSVTYLLWETIFLQISLQHCEVLTRHWKNTSRKTS